MIEFKEYEALIKKEARSMLSGLDQQKVWKFTGSQPQECPKCGVQVFDPFGFKRVIHDIVACSLRNACALNAVARSWLLPKCVALAP